MRGLPPEVRQLLEVLIQKRNQKVIADLKVQLQQVGPRGSIAVFYGTGHMPDLEARLRKELRYHPAGQLWLTAFSVNLAQGGISNADRQFIRSLVRQGMEQTRPRN